MLHISEIGASKEKKKKTVVLADGNFADLKTGKEILRSKYKIYAVLSGEIIFNLLEKVFPDIILLSVEMPKMNGFDVIRRLKQNPIWAKIPVVFITDKLDEKNELMGLNMGALDYIVKPISGALLLRRIENYLALEEQKSQLKGLYTNLSEIMSVNNRQVAKLLNSVLSTVTDLVEFRDGITGSHITRTQKYIAMLIDQMLIDGVYSEEVRSWDLNYLLPSVQLHDVGKIAISDFILNKPGPLTVKEFETMKTHVIEGVKVIRKIEDIVDEHVFLRYAYQFASGHHEKWNGKGYPAGLRGEEIPLEGRLMAIVDVYDALVSKRPYKNPFDTEIARRLIENESGKHFDPKLVNVFSAVESRFSEIVKSENILTAKATWSFL